MVAWKCANATDLVSMAVFFDLVLPRGDIKRAKSEINDHGSHSCTSFDLLFQLLQVLLSDYDLVIDKIALDSFLF